MAHLKNYMEEIVFHQIKDILKDINNMCDCEQCIMDIAAIALNDLPPKYVVTEKGEVYSKISALKQQFDVDVIAAITKAAVIVKRKPKHD